MSSSHDSDPVPLRSSSTPDGRADEEMELYELSEEPELRPGQAPSLAEMERIARAEAEDADFAEAGAEEKRITSRPASGPESHFSGEEPRVVDPAVAASRREEERIRGAQMFAAEEARRKKVRLIIWGVLALLVLGGYLLLRSVVA